MKIWGKRHIIIVSKMIRFLNFWFASFSSDSSESLTLMTLWDFKHFRNSVSLTLIPYEGFELLDNVYTYSVTSQKFDALWPVYILNKVRHRIFPHSSLCFTAFNMFWSFQRHIICDIIFYPFLRMLDLFLVEQSDFLLRLHAYQIFTSMANSIPWSMIELKQITWRK